MNGIPVVTLKIEGMAHEIKVALSQYLTKMDSDFAAAIDAAVNGFNLEREVAKLAPRILEDSIREIVNSAVQTLKWDKELRAAIRAAVIRNLWKSDSESGA